MMKILSNLVGFIFSRSSNSHSKGGVPSSLKKVIDDYDTAAVLTVYDTNEPQILYANKLHKKLTGYSTSEVANKTPKIFQGAKTSEQTRKEMHKELSRSSFWHGTVVNYRKNGEEISVNLLIFAICYEGHKYYVALKKLTSEE
jgi:PAS domain S-box-containing protein